MLDSCTSHHMRLEWWPLIGSVFRVLVCRWRPYSDDTCTDIFKGVTCSPMLPCLVLFLELSLSFSLPVLSMLTGAEASPEFRILSSSMGQCPECHGFFGVISSFSSTLEWSDLSFCSNCRFGRCPNMFHIWVYIDRFCMSSVISLSRGLYKVRSFSCRKHSFMYQSLSMMITVADPLSSDLMMMSICLLMSLSFKFS